MTLFEMIKDQVPVHTAAEQYGLQVNRSGMCKCPFHQDNDPSMKFYNKRFHCFGCTADGDVIDFTSRLFNISLTDAAKKLAADFGIHYDQSFTRSVNPKYHEISEADKLKHYYPIIIIAIAFLQRIHQKYDFLNSRQSICPKQRYRKNTF